MAISASFNAGTGVLSVTGDALNNTIVASRDLAGTILIDRGAVPVQGGAPTVANTSQIQVSGSKGANSICSMNPMARCPPPI